MPRTSEPAFNPALAEALRGKHPRWREPGRIGAEQTNVLRGHPAERPDVVIRHPGGAPVIVETEWDPAATVEDDARARLDAIVDADGEAVEQAIAVRVPPSLRRDQEHLAERIAEAEFGYCVFTHREGEPADPERWPRSGWLRGGIDALAGLIEQASLSERRIEEGMRILQEGVGQAAARLRSGLEDQPYTRARIAAALRQEEGEQTSRMAMAIVANALTFHAGLAGSYGIPPIGELRGELGRMSQHRVLETWRYILAEVNYWPIFRIASDVLSPIRPGVAAAVLERLRAVADELDGIGVTSTQDLAGQMFGRLITDRKFLATFYTLPTSSALLAELAVSRLDADWADPDAVTALRVADLACGAGVLLSAAYRAIAARHRRAGGDDEPLHRAMMEDALIGADIMPAATHLTASMLSGAHPTVTFGRTRIHTMPYGRQGDVTGRPAAIGSLDLIASDAQPSLFGTGEHVLTGAGEAEEVGDYTQRGDELRLPRESADLVIMNPPFTRPLGHEGEIDGRPVPVSSFAGFDTSEDEQRAMAETLRGIRRHLTDVAGHGYAGLASNFIDLAHAKVKPDGVLALVLPVTVVAGEAWSAARNLLARHYRDLTVVTIAATGQTARAFSADTTIGEALVLATKRDEPSGAGAAETEALYANLYARPRSIAEGAAIGDLIHAAPDDRAGLLWAGDEVAGGFVRATLADGGCAQVRETDVAEAAMALRGGMLRLSRLREALPVPIAPIGSLGEKGLHDMQITGKAGGPFDAIRRRGIASYPMLWSHVADSERRLIVEPDREGRIRPGRRDQAITVWETATRLHINRDFGLASQSLAACLTPKRTIGGTAWPNFRVEGDPRREEALALWANTTLGLIAFWWTGTRQHMGRARITISALPSLPALDVRELTDAQLGDAAAIFGAFADREFLPANEAYRDPARQALDRAVLVELLGLPEAVLEPLEALRRQWCAEPTVHGGKSTRPA